MKILQLCKKPPYPPKDGESIAIWNLTAEIAKQGHEITVVAMSTVKHPFDKNDFSQTLYPNISLHVVEVNTNIRILDALANLFSSKSYNIERFISKEYKEKLKKILKTEKYDVIQLEGLYLCPLH